MREFAILVLAGFAAACSGGAASDVPDRLAELAGKPGTVLVARDTADMYWAVPTSGIRHVSGRTIAVQPGTAVAGGSGEGAPESVAQTVLDQWPDGGPYFMTTSGETKVSGQVGTANAEILLEIEEVVLTRAE